MPSFLHCAPLGKLYLSLACLLSLWNAVSAIKEEAKKEKLMTFLPTAASGNNEVQKEKDVAFLGATELPARSVDLSALNLTELVNSMLARALRDSRKFFSLLSITSYSSFAFHKFSVAIYNISNLKTVDPVKFPTRYCYCLNNRTNDLSDFTALLVDIIGNSTSYLTEIFKSTSILSVSQTNESDCIFICVMTGKSGRNLSDFWEMAEKSPVINYTFTSSTSGVQRTQTPSPTKAPAPKYPHAGDLPAAWPFSRGEEPALVPWPHQVSRCPQPFPKEGAQTAAPPTLAFQKLNPCLMELCRFFQQCLCMAPKRVPGMEAVRYCLDYYSWFLKNATYICQRMKRVSWSYTLKQKCLENICKSV
ncbi:HERV-H LTR-associating protein 1 [Talpa occidentalis]|uniref:HERV-H LTR-associating protein 1 n=1 Tax=Talpa occidentalis TaxID=50954 RepID=UPI0023F7F692|nr:HERV-H LTR-associating protein 1 [Talpa occidentalis]